MKTFIYLIFFISTLGHSQTDSLYKQIELDSFELIKTQLRIDSLKLQLDSLNSESKKTQVLIQELKQENIRLAELMKLYIEQINRKEEKGLKEEE